ncbi:MAG: hypothetical protein ACJ79S_06920 [Gemmatimonadaceae bacterium]
MDWSIRIGRYLFAASMALFGVLHLGYASGSTFAVGAPWVLYGPLWGFLTAAVLLGASVRIATSARARLGASVLAGALLLYALCSYAPGLLHNIRAGGSWTGMGEILSLSGAAFVLAGTLGPAADDARPSSAIAPGRVLYAVPLIIFGVQHFIYAPFVVALIPGWIPSPYFWAYFVGVAFIAASLSLLTGWKAQWAAALLGVQFGLWVLIVHIPRALVVIRQGNEWTGAGVALGMCGGAWLLAGTIRSSAGVRVPQSANAARGRGPLPVRPGEIQQSRV